MQIVTWHELPGPPNAVSAQGGVVDPGEIAQGAQVIVGATPHAIIAILQCRMALVQSAGEITPTQEGGIGGLPGRGRGGRFGLGSGRMISRIMPAHSAGMPQRLFVLTDVAAVWHPPPVHVALTRPSWSNPSRGADRTYSYKLIPSTYPRGSRAVHRPVSASYTRNLTWYRWRPAPSKVGSYS